MIHDLIGLLDVSDWSKLAISNIAWTFFFFLTQCGVLQEDVMSPTLSEKCQFHVIPSPSFLSSFLATPTTGPTVHCEPIKAEEQEDMETETREGQLSVTINVHVGELTSII